MGYLGGESTHQPIRLGHEGGDHHREGVPPMAGAVGQERKGKQAERQEPRIGQ